PPVTYSNWSQDLVEVVSICLGSTNIFTSLAASSILLTFPGKTLITPDSLSLTVTALRNSLSVTIFAKTTPTHFAYRNRDVKSGQNVFILLSHRGLMLSPTNSSSIAERYLLACSGFLNDPTIVYKP